MNMMRVRLLGLTLLVVLLHGGAGNVRAELVTPVVTGVEWKHSTAHEKRSFLLGVATMVALENEIQAQSPDRQRRSSIPVFARGMKDMTLIATSDWLDNYYATNQDMLRRPVIDVLWFELCVPAIEKAEKAAK